MIRHRQLIWAWWGWEPMRYYRRPGAPAHKPTELTTLPLDPWYRMLHAEDTVWSAASIGINCIVTHFLKGFGLEHEQDEVRETKRLVELCHRYGIEVFGYLQYGTLFPETFFQERAEARQWIQRREDGSPALWNDCQDRYVPCTSAPGYGDYLRSCIRVGLEEVRLDGLHFDNFFFAPCYCQHCREAYRRDTGEELPPMALVTSAPDDVRVGRWAQWRCEQLTCRLEELRDAAREVNPGVKLIWNPGTINGVRDRRLWGGADFFELGSQAELLWTENTHFPGVRDGVPIHQVNEYKTAEAVGYETFSTLWKGQYAASCLPQRAEEIALLSAETTVWGACPGNNWLMRPEYIMQLPDGVLCREWAKQLSYVRVHEDVFYGSCGHGEVALYLDRARCNEDFTVNYGCFLSLQQLLLQGHVSYDLVFSGQEERLRDYGVVVTLFPVVDEGAFAGRTVVTCSPEELSADFRSYDKDYKVPVPAGAASVLSRIVSALGCREVEVLSAPETVLIEHRLGEDGRHLLHLVSYDAGALIRGVRIRFREVPHLVRIMSVDEGVNRVLPIGDELMLPPWKVWVTVMWPH